VEPAADVLDVVNDRVHALEQFRRRFSARAVEAEDRQAGRLVAAVADPLVERAAQAVLGAEKHDELNAGGLMQEVDGGAALAVSAGVVGDQRDRTALQAGEVLGGEDVDAGQTTGDAATRVLEGSAGAKGPPPPPRGRLRTAWCS